MAQTKMRAKPKTKRENLGRRRRSSAGNPQGKTPRNGSLTPGLSREGRQDETLSDLPGPDVIDKR